MTYLLIGDDLPAKDEKVAELKKKFLSSAESFHFDCETLYAQKLDSETLQKALIALPVVSSKRVVVIRECEKLDSRNQEIILKTISSSAENSVVILDFNRADGKSSFMEKLKKAARPSYFEKEKPPDVFALGNAILAQKDSEALKILAQLLAQGEFPLRILGFLVWKWRHSGNRASSEAFQRGLEALQEADVNIKRSRLKPEHALELLIVRLSAKGAQARSLDKKTSLSGR